MHWALVDFLEVVVPWEREVVVPWERARSLRAYLLTLLFDLQLPLLPCYELALQTKTYDEVYLA